MVWLVFPWWKIHRVEVVEEASASKSYIIDVVIYLQKMGTTQMKSMMLMARIIWHADIAGDIEFYETRSFKERELEEENISDEHSQTPSSSKKTYK